MEALPDAGLLPDFEIRRLALHGGMVDPFCEATADPDTISYGLSSAGYDARLGDDVQILDQRGATERMIDPKDGRSLASWLRPARRAANVPGIPALPTWDVIARVPDVKIARVIPPYGFALGHTVERFRVPRDVLVVCLGKSTYARCGLIVNVTPLEPGWRGQVTLELHNTTMAPILVYPGEGICQFLFFRTAEAPERGYADKTGGSKYMDQSGITLPRMPRS